MNTISQTVVAAALLVISGVAGADTVVYAVDFTVTDAYSSASDTVTGSITTDGNPTLAATDITAFSLKDTNGASVTGSNADVTCDFGCGLTVVGSKLLFNFGDTTPYGHLLNFTSNPYYSQTALEFMAAGQSITGGFYSQVAGATTEYASNGVSTVGTAVAPEIDAQTAANGLSLLAVSLLLLRGRCLKRPAA